MEATEQTRPEKMHPGRQAEFKAGEIMVRFKASAQPEALERFFTDTRLSVLRRLNLPGLYLLSIEDDKSVPEKIKEIETHSLVAYAEPNYIHRLDALKEKPAHVPSELLVRFAAKTEKARVEDILKELDLVMMEAFSLPNLYRVKIKDPSAHAEEIIKQLIARTEVLSAEPNYIYTIESSAQ